jgi:DNA-binding CsgD family transcriptional regulator
MQFLKSCYFLIVPILCSDQALTQVKEIGLPAIANYTRSDYKGGTQNWGIGQDRNDNLYFANNAGLFQFDGISWAKFSLPNHPSVRSLIVVDDKIYVGGYNDFGYFKANEKGKLIYHSLISLLSENDRKGIDFIWKIHQYHRQIVFQSFGHAYIYDGKSVRQLDAPGRFQFSFSLNDKLYFQDVSIGLLEFINNRLVPLKGTHFLNNTEVWSVLPFSNSSLLIITQKKGAFVYANDTLLAWGTESDSFLKKNGCLGGVMLKEKLIAFNSVLDGVIISDTNGRILQHINQKKGLQNNTVLTSFVDNKSNLWLGLDNGIDFINEGSPLTYLGSSHNISTVYASVVHRENVYVATNRGLFYRSQTRAYEDDAFALVEGTTGQAWNIQLIGGELFCAHNSGLLQVVGSKVFKNLDEKGYWGIKRIPGRPDLLIGSNYNGFSFFEKKGRNWTLRNNIEGLNKATGVFEIEQDNVWMIKDDVLYRCNLNHDFTRFLAVKICEKLSEAEKGPIRMHRINGKVYFQSNNRFYLWGAENDLFLKDKAITSLFDSIPLIRFLHQDVEGNIWYWNNESLGMLKKAGNSSGYRNVVAPFSGLKGNLMIDYPSFYSLDSTNIFIGLTNGLAHFNTELINYSPGRPKVFIRTFSSPDDTIVLANNGDLTVTNINIPYQSNNITLTFSSPIYENPAGIEFSYKLEGFDAVWSNWTTINFKEYTNLREGTYKMLVKTRNGSGLVSGIDSISFVIAPPFYRHWLAYCIYILIAGLLVLLLRHQVKMKIRKNKYYETVEQRKLYLEKEAKIRLEQDALEKEIEKLKMEKLKITILAKDKELVNNSFQVVRKNKILNGIIQNIKNINEEALNEPTRTQLNKLSKSISKELDSDKNWEELEKHIKNVHFDFLKRLKEKYPAISSRELDLSTYLLLNMSSKEIAEIMNISNAGVELARYRLRKKIGLQRHENLVGFLMSI